MGTHDEDRTTSRSAGTTTETTSLEPAARNASRPAFAPGTGKITWTGLAVIVASIVTNGIQWWSGAAAAGKTRAEAAQLRASSDKDKAELDKLKQEQSESGEHSVQRWIEELRKCATVEDRVMVLDAAIATSADPRVAGWATGELTALQAPLAVRTKAAEQRVALIDHGQPTGMSSITDLKIGAGGGVGRGTGGSGLGGIGGGVGPAPAATVIPVTTASQASHELAISDLTRLTNAQRLVAANLKK